MDGNRMLDSQSDCSDAGHIYFENRKTSAEKFEEAIPLHKALKELYESLTKALENDPPPEVRMNLWQFGARNAPALDRERVL